METSILLPLLRLSQAPSCPLPVEKKPLGFVVVVVVGAVVGVSVGDDVVVSDVDVAVVAAVRVCVWVGILVSVVEEEEDSFGARMSSFCGATAAEAAAVQVQDSGVAKDATSEAEEVAAAAARSPISTEEHTKSGDDVIQTLAMVSWSC